MPSFKVYACAFLITLFNCKKVKNSIESKKDSLIKTSTQDKKIEKKSCYFSLDTISGVKKEEGKYSDVFSGNKSMYSKILKKKRSELLVKFMPYTYKDSIVFYVNEITYVNENSNILDSIQRLSNKRMSRLGFGRFSERSVLFFKKDEAFKHKIYALDVPPNWDYLKIRAEFINKVKKCALLICDRSKPCEILSTSILY